MNDVYAGLEPAEVWRHFDALNKIGRPSGREAAARDYVLGVGAEARCTTKRDAYGNCVVYVGSRNGSKTPVCVQAHLDMVMATDPGIAHDFVNDPIVPRRVGDRIVATGTTLGADNGIGAAMALALITDKTLSTGPLELLFTVEEETGLKGASALDGSLITAKSLINLDSEDPPVLTIGCAGGESLTISVPVSTEPVPEGWVTREVHIAGLRGGHSGVEIHKNLGNAIQLLSSTLLGESSRNSEMRIVSIAGGSAHNAVPKEAIAKIAMPASEGVRWDRDLADAVANRAMVDQIRQQLQEPGLTVDMRSVEPAAEAITAADSKKLAHLLFSIPTGVLTMSNAFPGKVQTSRNLAVVAQGNGKVDVLVSLRSFVAADIAAVETELREMAESVGASVQVSSAYPSWEPNPDSRLLSVTKEAFEQVLNREPIVEVVHAGLECGVISAKVPGMEAVSFGPKITGAHTPEESVYPDSVKSTWKLLVEVLGRLGA